MCLDIFGFGQKLLKHSNKKHNNKYYITHKTDVYRTATIITRSSAIAVIADRTACRSTIG